MQKLPSCGLLLGFTVLILSATVGWIVIPKVIHKKVAEVLKGCKTWIVDGTFRISPKLYGSKGQIYTVHGVFIGHDAEGRQRKEAAPLVYAILPDKKKKTYIRLFRKLLALLGGYNPDSFLVDFEAAAINAIQQQVRLVNGSQTFERWRDVPVPIYVKFYLFNVTNPGEVTTGAKPKLQEVGPFTYRQKRQKVDIKINRNDTVTYRQTQTYFFEPELSKGSLQDVVTVLNLPFLGIIHKASRMSVFARSLVLQYLEDYHEQVFIQKTVDEILFKGYYVDFMEDLSGVLGYKLLPNDTFGLYYAKNGTDHGVFEVFSGVKDTSKFGVVASWNGSPKMPWWEDEKCSKVKGTDGSIFPPFLNPENKLEMFSADLCRTLRLVYDRETKVGELTGYRYVVDPEILEDPVFNRDNMCYCTQPGTKYDNCPKHGAYQINACRKETPLLISFPHFLDAGKEYQESCEGLHPDKSKHETVIVLEPTSGLLLRAAKRIQVNMELKPFKFVKQFKKVPKMIFPIVWVDESAQMTPDGQARVKSKLVNPQKYSNYAAWGGVVLGLLMIIIATVVYLMRARKKNYHS